MQPLRARISRSFFVHAGLPVGAALLFGVTALALRAPLETNVDLRAGFFAKDALGTDATIPPDLKTIGFDDLFLSTNQRTDLSLAEWGALMRAIDARGVAAIHVDKRFGLVSDQAAAAGFVETMRPLTTKVVAAAWTRPYLLQTEPLLALKDHFAVDLQGRALAALEHRFDSGRGYVYGPHRLLAPAFGFVGHVNYAGGGRVDALTVSHDGVGVPNMLLAARPLRPTVDGGLASGDYALPLDGRGRLTINFPKEAALLSRTLSVTPLLNRIAKGKPLDVFAAGDTVLIVPGFYTGGTDMVMTPRGQMPGGFVWAAGLANVSTKSFINVPAMNTSLYLLMPLLFALGILALPSRLILRIVVACGAAYAAGALGAFAYGDLMIVWAGPLSAASLVAVVTFAARHQQAEREILKVRQALDGVVAASQLERLIKNPAEAQTEVIGKVVSVMFVDVVGFSRYAGNRSAREAYDMIRSLLGEIIAIIHEHNGCVDRVLGDGLLCYFGHDHTTQHYDGNHAHQAVACAVAIQRHFLAGTGNRDKQQTLPLRIGINTCPVVFGDLGSARRRDSTLIGDGVNFAKRLESACDLYRVCISTATRSMLTAGTADFSMRRRMIPVKHMADAVEAFEVEPHQDQDAARRDAVRRYYEFLGLSRTDVRADNVGSGVQVFLNGHQVAVRNISLKGLAVELNDYWAHGVTMQFELRATTEKLQAELERFGLAAVMGEVRWAEPVNDKTFLHGILIKNLSDRQREALLTALATHSDRILPLRQAG